jgi:hypothetical protein
MVKRERGWALDECGKDVWSEVMTPNGKLYEWLAFLGNQALIMLDT